MGAHPSVSTEAISGALRTTSNVDSISRVHSETQRHTARFHASLNQELNPTGFSRSFPKSFLKHESPKSLGNMIGIAIDDTGGLPAHEMSL